MALRYCIADRSALIKVQFTLLLLKKRIFNELSKLLTSQRACRAPPLKSRTIYKCRMLRILLPSFSGLRCGYVMPEVGNECNFRLLLLHSMKIAPAQLLWHCLCYYRPEGVTRTQVLFLFLFVLLVIAFPWRLFCLEKFWLSPQVYLKLVGMLINFNFIQFGCQKCKAFALIDWPGPNGRPKYTIEFG